MTEPYTPDDDQIKYRYQLDVSNSPIAGRSFDEAGAEFDRWLAAHDADVKAEALEEFAAKVRGELAETALVVSLGDDYLHGMNSALGQCIDRAAELRAAEVGNLSTRGGV